MSVYILVVNDEPDVADLFRQQFRRELRAQRFVMEFAMSAPEALERVKTISDPSLILMDLSLPRMGGVELLPQIRQALQRRSTPVIVFSASEDQQAVAKCYEAGATSFVLKPSDLDDLIGTLKHIANFWCNQVTASAAGSGAECHVVQHAVGAGA